jgi:4-azaleucine resistance transporter AzlC
MKDKRNFIKIAFIKSIPILCSYIFLGMAYGIMMEEAGLSWYYSLFASFAVYTGAFQFVLITFLSTGASWITIAATAFLMNSRQTFYALTFLEDFKRMGKRKPYMIFSLTDETYAVNCTLEKTQEGRDDIMFWVALFSHFYWVFGSVCGALIGQLIPFEMEGIDFCMTALFVIIFIDQWEKSTRHFPALLGIAASVLCLFFFGTNRFMLPSLLLVSGILLLTNERKEETP